MSRRREHDHYGRRAQAEGKAARSIFKLEEIDQRFKVVRAGMRVLDLGCVPGSWLQYLADRVGSKGYVLGIDLTPVRVSCPPFVETRVADIFKLAPGDLGGPYDLVLSDMAPHTMGYYKTDSIRSAGLVEQALTIADALLRPSGHVVAKILEGGEVPALVTRMRAAYEKVERVRTQATRRESSELFLVGLRKRSPVL